MTETRILDEGAVSEIEARANAATPGPWAVWDSCSWRRIGTVEPFRDGNVICPITQNDGHLDLLAKREDLEFAAHAREDIPALCATVKYLRNELRRWQNGDVLPNGWTGLDAGDGFPNLYLYSRSDVVEQAKQRLADLQSQLEQLRTATAQMIETKCAEYRVAHGARLAMLNALEKL